MNRRRTLALVAASASWVVGCSRAVSLEASPKDGELVAAAYHPPKAPAPRHPMAAPIAAPPQAAELVGPQPVDAFIRRALAENRTIQAAYHNVQSLKYRIPQVTALEDPVASNAIFPIPSVAPQYSLMGYNPYNVTLAQQFPWFGTLRLRGEVAARDVQIGLAELAAAQLDAVAAVKRAYCDLYATRKTEGLLAENRKLLEDFLTIARRRLEAGGSQKDVLRAEVLIAELDREMAGNEQAIATARAALARQVHASPEMDLRTLPELPTSAVPAALDRLYALAIAARPELRGRLEAVARDEKAVELARLRSKPNVTLGLTYMLMEKTNAMTPRTAEGMPNVGLFVAFNLPVNREKYRAGVCEAKERALADAKLYEAQADEACAEIADLMAQARVQRSTLGLLRDQILPRIRQAQDLAGTDYAAGNADFATLISALREVLQVQVQIAQVEAELGKAMAALERAVGCQINEHPPSASAPATNRAGSGAGGSSAPPPSPGTRGPFSPPRGDAPRLNEDVPPGGR